MANAVRIGPTKFLVCLRRYKLINREFIALINMSIDTNMLIRAKKTEAWSISAIPCQTSCNDFLRFIEMTVYIEFWISRNQNSNSGFPEFEFWISEIRILDNQTSIISDIELHFEYPKFQ